jgi:hypothetical protein
MTDKAISRFFTDEIATPPSVSRDDRHKTIMQQ